MNTYYHNPKCSKSREGLEILKQMGVKFQIKEYLKEGFDKEELRNIFKLLQKSPEQVVRSKEKVFEELNLKNKVLSLDEWIETIIKYPMLMERPILKSAKSALIGRPPEVFKSFNDQKAGSATVPQ